MNYVIVRADGHFVARAGSGHSYTDRLQLARVYPTRDAAERERCPGNEYVLSVHDAMRGA